jgi:chromosome segregation protein
LNANIRERKEMIEDALGLKIFQYKKEESLRKLEKTEDNIKQVESLRREIAPHIKFLKKQVEKIEKAEEMRNQLINLYHEYFCREEEYINFEKKEIALSKKPLIEKTEELENELRKAKEILEKSSSKDQKTDEIMKIEGELKEARISKDAYARNLGRIEGEVSSLLRLIKKQKEDALTASQKMITLRDVENMAKEINLEIDSVLNVGDLPKIKEILSSVKNILLSFLNKQKEGENHRDIGGLEEEIKNSMLKNQGLRPR